MKKNMKKVNIIIVLVLMIQLTLTGCGVKVSEDMESELGIKNEGVTEETDTGTNAQGTKEVIEKFGIELKNLDLDGTLHGQYSGKTLTIPVMSGDFENAINAAVPLFEELTGAQVIVESIPGDQFMDKVNLDLSSENRYDVILAPISFLHGFAEAGRMTKLETVMGQYASKSYDAADFLDGLYKTYGMYKGEMYAMPYKPDVELLFYRKDIFEDEAVKASYKEKYGVDLKVPETNDAMLQVAEFFTKSNNSESPTDYGYVNMMMKGSTRLVWINRGAKITDSQLMPSFNNAEGLKALDYVIKLQESAPKEWLQMGWDEANTFFANGNAAMMEQWPGLWNTCNAEGSLVKDKIGVAITPGKSPVLGGWGVGINSETKEEELAWKFIEFATSKDGELLKVEYTMDPCRASSYDIQGIKDYNPLYGVLMESFSYASTLADVDVPYISSKLNDTIELCVQMVLSTNSDPQEALNLMEEEFLKELRKINLIK